MDTFFLLIEYTGVPIGLMLYSIIIKQLSTFSISDPIAVNKKKETLWGYGLELMAIICISTLLFGISFAGHTNGEKLNSYKIFAIITCVLVSLIEFFILIVYTFLVRKWGEHNFRTKIYPNFLAFLYWVILVMLIIVCSKYSHQQNAEIELLPTATMPLNSSWLQNGNNTIFIMLLFALIIINS